MPFTVRLEPERKLAVAVFSGTVDGDAILQAMQALYEAGGWTPGFSVLWDYRLVTKVVFLPEDLSRIVGFGFSNQERGGPGIDVNLVNRRNDLHVLASKTFVAYRRYQKNAMRVPYDAADVVEAADLLGLPLPVVEAALDEAQPDQGSA